MGEAAGAALHMNWPNAGTRGDRSTKAEGRTKITAVIKQERTEADQSKEGRQVKYT